MCSFKIRGAMPSCPRQTTVRGGARVSRPRRWRRTCGARAVRPPSVAGHLLADVCRPRRWLTSAAPFGAMTSAAPRHGVSTRPPTRSARRPFTSSTFTVLLTNPHDVTPTTTSTPGPLGTASQLPTDRKVVQGPGNQCDVGGGQAILDPYILLTKQLYINKCNKAGTHPQPPPHPPKKKT